jgi:hypothetical protein
MHRNDPTRLTTTINGHLYFNGRVPKHATAAFGPQVRLRISDFAEADRLTRRHNDIWAEDSIDVSPDLEALLAATTTKQATLTTTAKAYVERRRCVSHA